MAETKLFAFRFDVDTHKCLRDGVPNLIKIAESSGVRFTFFVLMGRAVSRARFLMRRFASATSEGPEEGVQLMSAFAKLGAADYLRVAILNPKVGAGYGSLVRLLHETGHEIGIHGGRNHESWHFGAHLWSEEKIESEVLSSLRLLHEAGIRPTGFSSPGWTTVDPLERVLKRNGFIYVADDHGADQNKTRISANGIVRVPTNILGEPGGVGYLEHCRVQGFDDDGILRDFKRRLEKSGDLAVAYDHPYYAGTQEIHLLPKLLNIARDMGFRITTLGRIAEKAS